MEKITGNAITVAQYAERCGTSPQNIYQRIERNKKKGEKAVIDHVFKEGNLTYLDEVAVDFFDRTRREIPTVVDSKEIQDRVKELELRLEEMTADRDQQRNEKEVYMKQLLEFQQKGIDTSKYIAIEDHRKIEEELNEKKKQIEDLEEEKKKTEEERDSYKTEKESLEKSVVELRDVSIKNAKLTEEIKQKTEEYSAKELENGKLMNELELEKAARKRIEQENQENLNLSIFGFLKKRKQNRREQSSTNAD